MSDSESDSSSSNIDNDQGGKDDWDDDDDNNIVIEDNDDDNNDDNNNNVIAAAVDNSVPKDFSFLKFEEHRSILFNPANESVIFYLTGATYAFNFDLGTIIQLNGNLYDDASTPIYLQLHGFDPFFYFKVPDAWIHMNKRASNTSSQNHHVNMKMIELYIEKLVQGFNEYVVNSPKTQFKYEKNILSKYRNPIKEWSIIRGNELMGYQGSESSTFVKVVTTYPKFVKLFRDLIDNPFGRESMKSRYGGGDEGGSEMTLPSIPSWCDMGSSLISNNAVQMDIIPESSSDNNGRPPVISLNRPAFITTATKKKQTAELNLIIKSIKTYEADVDYIIRWMSETQRGPCEWYYIPRNMYYNITDKRKISNGALEIALKHTNMIPILNYKAYTTSNNVINALLKDIHPKTPEEFDILFPNFKQFSFDIETPADSTHFANPAKDPVLQIAVIVSDLQDKYPIKSIVLAIGKTPKPDNVDILYWFNNDKDLINTFIAIYNGFDPDIENGHNHAMYDWGYLIKRARAIGILPKTPEYINLAIGRTKNGRISRTMKETRGFKTASVKIPGRMSFDTMKYAQGLIPPRKECSLNSLMEDMLGETKEDMPYELITASQQTEDGRKRMASYCKKDTWGTYMILGSMKCVLTQMKLSQISKVMPQECMNRGQEAKVDGKVRYQCVPEPGSNDLRVLKVSGQYRISRLQEERSSTELDQIEQMMANETNTIVVGGPNDNNFDINVPLPQSSLPKSSLSSLKPPSKKRKMNKRKPSEIAALIKQKGIFSTFAQYGRDKDEYNPDSDDEGIADYDEDGSYKGATVIQPKRGYYGQVRMHEAEDIVHKIKGGVPLDQIDLVKSGDFIVDLEKCTIRDTKNHPGCTLDFAGMYPGIQMEHNISWDTLISTADIIKHKLISGVDYWTVPDYIDDVATGATIEVENPKNPKYVKAHIKKGIIPKIQEDLMKYRASVKQKMGQCKVNKNQCFNFQSKMLCLLELMKIRDKSIDKEDKKKNKEEYIYLNTKLSQDSSDPERLKKFDDYVAVIQNDIVKKFITVAGYEDMLAFSDKITKLLSNENNTGAKVDYMNEFFTTDTRDKLNAIVKQGLELEKKYQFQESIYDAIQNAIKAWMNSVYGKSGDKTSPYYVREMASSVTDTGRYMIRLIRSTVEKNFTQAAGYPFTANVIYGDTDSIFPYMFGLGILFKYNYQTGQVKLDMCEVDKYGIEMAKKCTTHFKPPTKLEYEKGWVEVILIEKKNYAYQKHVIGDPVPKQDVKGIETVKRGPPLFVRNVNKKVINKICMEHDINGAINHYIDSKLELRQGNVIFTDLIYMKRLSKDPKKYKNGSSPVLALIEKLQQRDENYQAVAGDILKWIVIDSATIEGNIDLLKSGVSDRIDDPIYVVKNNLPIAILEYEKHLDSVFFKIMKEVIWTITHNKNNNNNNNNNVNNTDNSVQPIAKKSTSNVQMKLTDFKTRIVSSKDYIPICNKQELFQYDKLQQQLMKELGENVSESKKKEFIERMNDDDDGGVNDIDEMIYDEMKSIVKDTKKNKKKEDLEQNGDDETAMLVDQLYEEEEQDDAVNDEIVKINNKIKALLLMDIKINNADKNNQNTNVNKKKGVALRTLWLYKKKIKSDLTKTKKLELEEKIKAVKNYIIENYGERAKNIFAPIVMATKTKETIQYGSMFKYVKNLKCLSCGNNIKRVDESDYNDDKYIVIRYDNDEDDGSSSSNNNMSNSSSSDKVIKCCNINNSYFNDKSTEILLCTTCSNHEQFRDNVNEDIRHIKYYRSEYKTQWDKCMKCTDGFEEAINNCRCTSCETLGKRLMADKKTTELKSKLTQMIEIKNKLNW